LGFQDPATPIMEGIIDFHNDVTFVLIVILFFVFWLLYITIRSFMVFLEKKDKKKVFNFPVKWYSNHNYN
jgi:heme/copper-type cytochrome/quinol oxidase subunit 2